MTIVHCLILLTLAGGWTAVHATIYTLRKMSHQRRLIIQLRQALDIACSLARKHGDDITAATVNGLVQGIDAQISVAPPQK